MMDACDFKITAGTPRIGFIITQQSDISIKAPIVSPIPAASNALVWATIEWSLERPTGLTVPRADSLCGVKDYQPI